MEWDFQPHFNDSVGKPVSSMWEFREALKQAAQEESEATGIAHDYTALDPRDRDAFGVSDEGVEINTAVNRGVRLPEHRRPTPDAEGGWGEPPPLEGDRDAILE
jgi:hypothetical protein